MSNEHEALVTELRDKSVNDLPGWARDLMAEAAALIEQQAKALSEAEAERARLVSLVADYEEVLSDKRRLTRDIDVAMNGEAGAAKQASLCDLIEPARRLKERAEAAESRLASARTAIEPFAREANQLHISSPAEFCAARAWIEGEKNG